MMADRRDHTAALRRPIRYALPPFALGVLALSVLTPAPAAAVDVQRVVSPLGIEAWLVESDAVPVISISFAFEGGHRLDPPDLAGRANLVSILLDEGAGGLDSAEFQRRLTDAAIQLSFDDGYDAFYGDMKTVTAYADEAFELLRLALTEPRFDPAPVERMRASAIADIARQVSQPGWLAQRAYYEHAFPGHVYGRPSRGTVETVSALTADDLRAFTAEAFTRDRLIIGVTGDISAAELAGRLDEVFGGLPTAGAPLDDATVESAVPGQRITIARDGPQTTMLMVLPGIARDDPDYYAAYVLNHILGGRGFGSRLMEEVRERRGLTYGIRSYLLRYRLAQLLIISTDVSNANVAEAEAVIREEIGRLADQGVTEQELDDAVTFLTGSFPLRLTSTDGLAGMLRAMQHVDLEIDYIDTYDDLLEAVTVDDIDRAAGRLLDSSALTTVVVGGAGDDAAADIALTAEEMAARELSDGGS